ncbi:phosphotransferase family protein [Streptomyces sp. NPDC056160]|uniref:phosphotransferase family protein n=1 Tax=Streptomyces sp. NPDC056160 TaxID=3345731 RepID=UPI0035D874DA
MTKPIASPVARPAPVASRTSSQMQAPQLPDDAEDRLRVQARHAAALLGVEVDGTECVWGWQGQSLSLPVLDTTTELWMKLRARPVRQPAPPHWSGAATAERVMKGLPVLRPVLVAQEAWNCEGFAYQAELTTRMPVKAFSVTRAAPAWVADLPAAWWADLRAALDSIQTVASAGLAPVAWQEAAARSVGAVVLESWVPSHGDVCAANLGAVDARAVLYDWDYIGLGPRYADAACLLLSSLDTPEVAARVKEYFGDQLESPDGLYAQSVVAAHWSMRFKTGEHTDLAPALRAHISRTGNRSPC